MQASSAVASEQYPVTSPNKIYENSHSVARESQCVTQQHNTQNTIIHKQIQQYTQEYRQTRRN